MTLAWEDAVRPSLPRRLLRDFWIGLAYAGASAMGVTPRQLGCFLSEDEAAGEPQDVPQGSPGALAALPPPAHPERMVPDEPLAEEASRLWDDLNLGEWPYL